MQRFEGYFKATDQTELFYQTWTPESARGVLVMTHGLAEHSECYHHVARELCDDGWKVFGWDMRGHGRSEGKRGFVRSIQEYIDDLGVFVDKVIGRKDSPVFFGHSMGGLVTVRFVETMKPQAKALTLSSPALGLSVQVPRFKEALAHIAVKWVPTLTMYNEIKYEDLTRDDEMLKSHYADNLRHDKISPGLFLSMMENFSKAADEIGEIKVPVFLQLSGEDRIVSTEASHEFFEKLAVKNKEIHVYADSLHEVFNDRERDKAISDLKKFVNPFLGAAT